MERRIICYGKVWRNNNLHEQGVILVSVYLPYNPAAFFQIWCQCLVHRFFVKCRSGFGVNNETGKNGQSEFSKFICLSAPNSERILVGFCSYCFFLAKIMN